MAKPVKQLTALQIKNAKVTGKLYFLRDGGGLEVKITPQGSKTWIFRYSRPSDKKRTNFVIGSCSSIDLSEARAKKEEFRMLLDRGIDPQEEKKRVEQEAESKQQDTFYLMAKSYFDGIYQQKAKNPNTREKNWARLENHVLPYIGSLHVSEVKVKTLVEIFEKVADYGNTIKKLNQLIGAIMDHAITKGVIESHNCRLAIKSFHIKPSTPNPTIKVDELAQLFSDLNKSNISKKTYLLICWSFLTGLRPNEAANAQWAEFDFVENLWHIPKERMKGQADKKRSHTVPLSRQALQVLELMRPLSANSPFVFVSRYRTDQPMNKATVNTALKSNGYKDKLTAHGIRAFIKTFLASRKVDRNVSETVLSHLLEGGDDLENTYMRLAVFMISTNHSITFTDRNGGFHRRRVIMHFDRKVPDSKKDVNFIDKIKGELYGIVKRILARFPDPQEARIILEKYRAQSEAVEVKRDSNHLIDFASAFVVSDERKPSMIWGSNRTQKTEETALYKAYLFYCSCLNLNNVMNLKAFKQALPDALRDAGEQTPIKETGLIDGYQMLNVHWKDRHNTIQRWENG